jgi:hypothetical protein
MHELYRTVTLHLKTQRDSAAALKLWDSLWDAYEQSGAEGVAKFIDKIIKLPNTDDEEPS